MLRFAAGLEYPSASEPMAWDEFVALAKKLTIDANGKTAEEEGVDANNIVQYGYVVDNWTWQPEVWALSNGGRWISEDGKEVVINSPETIESIQKVADLTLVEHVMPYNEGLEDNGIQRSIIDPVWDGSETAEEAINNGYDVATFRSQICRVANCEYSDIGNIQIQKVQVLYMNSKAKMIADFYLTVYEIDGTWYMYELWSIKGF